MADARPYDNSDYKLDDERAGHEQAAWNELLVDGEVNPLLRERSSIGLAAIAAALHQHGEHLRPDHLEKAIWWLKDWKAARVGARRTFTSSADFHQLMSSLKAGKGHLAASRSAGRYFIGASAVTAVFVSIAVVDALLFITGAGGWWTVSGVVLALFALAWIGPLIEKARNAWKVQDRKYFLECIRAAQCTEDLNQAGLFAFTESQGEPLTWASEKRFRGEMNNLQRQLGDALYFDHDRYLRAPFDEDLIRMENERGAPF